MRTILTRAAVGLCALIAILALALFIPAGTLRFWQAWLYLAVFALCVVLITAYLAVFDRELLARRVSAGPGAEREQSQRTITGVARVLLLASYVVAGLDVRFDWSAVPRGASIAADLLVVAGFGIVLLTFRANSYASGIVEVAPEQRVIDQGPYALVRHPMYAGAVLLIVATPIALGSWVALPFALGLILAIVARLLDEERYLSVHLDGYESYRTRVQYRLVPFVW